MVVGRYILNKFCFSFQYPKITQSVTVVDKHIPQKDIEETNEGLSSDIGLWSENMSGLIDYWVKVESSDLQNCNEDLFVQKSSK